MVPQPVVATTAGRVAGVRRHDGTFAFRGIPYAAPPVGQRYLDAPAPVMRWSGVRPSVQNGASPPQLSLPGYGATVPGSDYLNVNVFTPDPGAARLPVFVWFCAGGFVICNNAWPTLDGAAFARDGVVAVTVNHRVGPEGYALLEGAPDNRGSLDWLAALRWVRENIAAFGGDPSKVTIGGCSAGGATCFDLLVMVDARGLFQRALPMSGPPASGHRVAAEERNARFGRYLGVPMTREAVGTVDPDALVKAGLAFTAPSGTDPAGSLVRQHVGLSPTFVPELPYFRPVIDGDLIGCDPIDALRAGLDPDVDLLVGHAAHEIDGSQLGPDVTDAQVRSALGSLGLGPEGVESYRLRLGGGDPGRLLGQAVSDRLLRLWTTRAADARASHHPGRTYAYEFAFGAAGHGMDVPYLWDTLAAATGDPPPGAHEVAREVHGRAVRFITTGDPGWAPYDLERRTVCVFDLPCRVVEDPLHIERLLWGAAQGET